MTTKKTNKTNSMTAHSKELRKKTSAKWDKGRYINRVFKVDKNKPEQMALLAKFDSIDAESQIKRLKILVDSYFNDPVNQIV